MKGVRSVLSLEFVKAISILCAAAVLAYGQSTLTLGQAIEEPSEPNPTLLGGGACGASARAELVQVGLSRIAQNFPDPRRRASGDRLPSRIRTIRTISCTFRKSSSVAANATTASPPPS